MSVESENNPDKKVLKICHNPRCGYKSNQSISRCPKCSRPMWTTTEFRLLMSLLIPLGGFLLLIGVGLIILFEFNLGSGKSSWRGSQSALVFVYLIFGAIAAFGLSIISFGGWCVIFGKVNKGLLKIMFFGCIGLLLIAGAGRLILTILNS